VIRPALFLLVLVLLSCGQNGTEAQEDHETTPLRATPAAAPATPTPVPSASEPPAATPAGPECPKPVVVPPRVLASGWPGLLGKRVRLRVAPVRAIDFTTWLVVAGGQRFIVDAAPDTNWNVAHVFVVAGSTIVPVRGRVSLPELIVSDDCAP
jgi:hypothetical protein